MPFVEVEGFEPSYMPEHVHSCPWCYALLLRQYIRAMLLIVLRTGCSSHVSTTAHLLPFIDSDFFLKSVVLRLKHFHVLPALPFPVGSNLTLTSLRVHPLLLHPDRVPHLTTMVDYYHATGSDSVYVFHTGCMVVAFQVLHIQ